MQKLISCRNITKETPNKRIYIRPSNYLERPCVYQKDLKRPLNILLYEELIHFINKFSIIFYRHPFLFNKFVDIFRIK